MGKLDCSTAQAGKRNGKIELLRFICCIIVILFHCHNYYIDTPSSSGFGLFPRGHMSVEFFFMVSGYLMAAGIYRDLQKQSDATLGKNYLQFLWKKVLSILPYHLIAFALLFVFECVHRGEGIKEIIKMFLSVIPNFLLIQQAGFQYYNLNSPTWYISAMLLAMAIIYPLCRKFYSNYSYIIAPLSGFIIMGWLFHDFGTIHGVSKWTVLGYTSFLRAIAEINFGIFSFSCTRALKKIEWNKKERYWLTLFEVFCWILAFLFMGYYVPRRYEIYEVLLIFVAVTFTFSDVTFGREIFDNKVVAFLGKFSLPLYLNQKFALLFGRYYMQGYSLVDKVIVVLILSSVLGIVVMLLGDRLMKSIKKSRFHQLMMN